MTTAPHNDDNNSWANMSNEELLRIALKDDVSEGDYWDIVHTMSAREAANVVPLASGLCKDRNTGARALGVHLLCSSGELTEPLDEARKSAFLDLLNSEKDAYVLSTICRACNDVWLPGGATYLALFGQHSDPQVRLGVAYGLQSDRSQEAIDAKLCLIDDDDAEVRSWAAAGLGHQVGVDTKEIRAALFKHLQDESDDVSAEAFLGLALLGDHRIIEPLISVLDSDSIGRWHVWASKEIADRSLYPYLLKLKDWWNLDDELLLKALEACK